MQAYTCTPDLLFDCVLVGHARASARVCVFMHACSRVHAPVACRPTVSACLHGRHCRLQLKSEGKYDSGIVTIKGRSCKVVGKRVIYRDAASGGEVQHVELSMDRGVTWEAALAFK